MEYPWYQDIEDSNDLQQGDFIPQCPIMVPPLTIKEEDVLDVEIQLIDSIVLSQSCDLVNNNIEIVLVCPYFTLKTFIDSLPSYQINTKKAVARTIDNLRKGFLPGYHLLNKDRALFNDYLVVDFRNVYGIQIAALREICNSMKKRTRLLPPYREHLSQSFARYFMRVGLPQDIEIEGY